jgi:hypothetical protein
MQNTHYSDLCKNNKFVTVFKSPKLVRLCYFCVAWNTMFFKLRFYTLVEYIIDYIYNFFQKLLKLINIIFIFFKKAAYI